MTIDKELNQAIIYHKKMASIYKRNHNDSEGNAELKLVGWLEELKRLRAQEPCEDVVSREAIESILYELYEVCTNMDELVHCMDDNLKKLPSVTPKRMGKWISHYVGIDEDDYGWDCSECGEWFVMDEPYHYCPKCGAKMEGEKE